MFFTFRQAMDRAWTEACSPEAWFIMVCLDIGGIIPIAGPTFQVSELLFKLSFTHIFLMDVFLDVNIPLNDHQLTLI